MLERVRYQVQRSGAPVNVEVRITGWRATNNQQTPGSITRLENDAEVLTLTIASTAISSRIADGIFTNPQGR